MENKSCHSCKFAEDYNGVSFVCGFARETLGVKTRFYGDKECNSWSSFAGSDPYVEGEEVMSDESLQKLLKKGSKSDKVTTKVSSESCSACGGKGYKVMPFGFGDSESVQCSKCGGTGFA